MCTQLTNDFSVEINIRIRYLRASSIKCSKYWIGKIGSRSSLKYNFKTPATELISLASVTSAKGSSPRSNASRRWAISTTEPDTRNIPWWCNPKRLITRTQDLITGGISTFNSSKYSSKLPPNSFGAPWRGAFPIRRLWNDYNILF
jgi:hypothetical protein